jgi:hypothetical protein
MAESDAKDDFQNLTRVILEEGNKQQLIKEFKTQIQLQFSDPKNPTNAVQQSVIEYLSEVLTYIDCSSVVTSQEKLAGFFAREDFQATFTSFALQCFQCVADADQATEQPDQPLFVELDSKLESVLKSSELATRVFKAWTSKTQSEQLFVKICASYDDAVGNGQKQCIQSSTLSDIKELPYTRYTIRVFAKCTMSVTQRQLESILHEAIGTDEKLDQFNQLAKQSMSAFFKAVRDKLEEIKAKGNFMSRYGRLPKCAVPAFINFRVEQRHPLARRARVRTAE